MITAQRQPLVLASTSPYRRELLERLNLPFLCADPQVDETPLPDEAPEPLALRLAEAKARAVANQHPDALIIGSDQVAYLGQQRFGKPGNHPNAVHQLSLMSGKTVNFFTGLCLFNARNGKVRLTGIPTLVTFRDLTEEEIQTYLHREQPYNCAGAAKCEGLGIALLRSIRGDDPNALIGLPLIALCDFLKLENYPIL